jgi:LacI family transcriptional regulator
VAQDRRIGLLIDTSTPYGRGLIEGIGRHAARRPGWRVLAEPMHDRPPAGLARWRVDGLLVRALSRSIVRAAVGLEVPTVAFWGRSAMPVGGRVVAGPLTDGDAVGRMAAECFLDRGFVHLAWCGFAGQSNVRRGDAFAARVAEAGYGLERFAARSRGPERTTAREQRAMAAWLKTLPQPVGVFAPNDYRGRHVIDACHAAGLACPEQVAVLGVDNDPLLCEYAPTPLSSIELDAAAVGQAGARMLDRLLAGEAAVPPDDVLPVAVVTRKSTDLSAIADPLVAEAVALIRRRAHEPVDIQQLAAELPASRSALERRFGRVLGRSPAAELRRVRLEQAKALLERTDLPLKAVASRCGYGSPQRLGEAFGRALGETPAGYRRRRRGAGG